MDSKAMYVHRQDQKLPETPRAEVAKVERDIMTPPTSIEPNTRLCKEECHSREDVGRIALEAAQQWAAVAVENQSDQVGAEVQEVSAKS